LRDSIATDALSDRPTDAIETSLETLREHQRTDQGLCRTSGNIAAK
jgi:hypothetical protein